MLDSARHFIPLEVIRRNLDGLEAVKMNVFHWHLSENQGFRAESKKFPKLHESGSDSLYYTQDEIRDLIVYARDGQDFSGPLFSHRRRRSERQRVGR